MRHPCLRVSYRGAHTNQPHEIGIVTDPTVDYRRTYRHASMMDDMLIVQYLPNHPKDSAQAWLELLLANNWANLNKVFISNFEGTYKQAP